MSYSDGFLFCTVKKKLFLFCSILTLKVDEINQWPMWHVVVVYTNT